MRANSSRLVLVLWLAAQFSIGIQAQDVPVVDNLWRLIAQEDTDEDRRITLHDRLTPFVVQDLQGRPARTISGATTYRCYSRNLNELKTTIEPRS